MRYIVTTPNTTGTARLPLRGTIWAFSMDRAEIFDTRELAQAALDRAAAFSKKRTIKAATIDEVP